LQRVSVGLRFGLATQATGDERFVGEVVRIGAEVSRSDRTVAVEGVLPEVQAKLRPGMHAEVRLELGTLEAAVVVPSGSIVERAGDGGTMQSGVYVVADGKAHWVKVNVLGSAGDRSAVDAVEAGAAVVTLGQNNLRDGATVRVSEQAP
jgi:Cu(I)/Ag(I) efflux system membrane fusion protein